MNTKDRSILEDPHKAREGFVKLDGVVYDERCALAKKSEIQTLRIEHRLKSESSLAEKKEKAGIYIGNLTI